tara:strand:- start:7227 stop:8372 length:1146 start_codon:yes stop_codon:yes gene_type:complete
MKSHLKIPKNRLRKLRPFTLGARPYEFKYLMNKMHIDLIDLCSNDYFGMSRDKDVIDAAYKTSLSDGLGSGSSLFISGSRPIHELLEKRLSEWLGQEKILLFPSGFQANIAAMQALADRKSIVIADKLIHNSLLVGIKASGAKLVRFLHNDLIDLRTKLSKYCLCGRPIIVVVESLYSMEGTIAPLDEICKICSENNVKLFVDEAHALGILGPKGKGLSYTHKNSVNLLSGTFGKSFGSGGAFLACNSFMGEYLIQTSGAFRYTTALSPSLAAGALKSLEKLQTHNSWREDLIELSKEWKKEIQNLGQFNIKGNAHILSIIIGDDSETISMQRYLEKNGFLAMAIRPPTVPIGQSRIRLTIRSTLNKNILKKFINALKNYK